MVPALLPAAVAACGTAAAFRVSLRLLFDSFLLFAWGFLVGAGCLGLFGQYVGVTLTAEPV